VIRFSTIQLFNNMNTYTLNNNVRNNFNGMRNVNPLILVVSYEIILAHLILALSLAERVLLECN